MMLGKFAGRAALALIFGALACTSTSSNTNDEDDGDTNASSGGSGSGGNAGSGSNETTDGMGGSGPGSTTGGAGEAGAAGADPGSDSSDSGGSGGSGDGGSAGTGGQPSATLSDSCEGSAAEPNEDRDSATPYALGTEFEACLQTRDDFDWYEFSTPDDDRGGVVIVRVTDVGPDGDIDLTLWSALDNGEIHSTGGTTEGASRFFNFNAQPGATFRLEVTNYFDLNAPNPYLLTISYQQVADVHEPNDTRPSASPIEVGEAVEGYSFAGWENSSEVAEEQWYDWYEIDLEAGPTSILMDIVASDINGEIVLYDPLGSELADEGSITDGSSQLLEYEIEEAGTYFIRLAPYFAPATLDNTVDPPEYTSTPYTLTVTQ